MEIYFETSYIKAKEINSNFDEYSTLLKISQPLSMFFTKSLEDQKVYIQLASLRALEFLIETLGCSLGMLIPFILEQILNNYPKGPL